MFKLVGKSSIPVEILTFPRHGVLRFYKNVLTLAEALRIKFLSLKMIKVEGAGSSDPVANSDTNTINEFRRACGINRKTVAAITTVASTLVPKTNKEAN